MIRRPTTLLVLLTALNLLNYLDRYVLSAVLKPIRSELHLNNLGAGFFGTVFLLGYFLTSPIFGPLGDRGRRNVLLAVGIFVWSLATIGSGFATGVVSLVIARALVGIGEASYSAIAPTLIDDVAPVEKKGRWLSIFYAATPLGAALGYTLGGFVGKAHGWRAAFWVAGVPGLLLAFLCLLIHEPARRARAERFEFFRFFRELWPLPLYRQAVLGYSAYTFAIGAFAYWAPTFLADRYGLEIDVASSRFGLITIVGGLLGTVFGGRIADKVVARAVAKLGPDPAPAAVEDTAVRVNMRVCAVSSAIGAPLAAACFLSPSPGLFFVFAFFCETAVFILNAPINAVILQSVPSERRASAMALAIFTIHLLGDVHSPYVVGAIADLTTMTWGMMLLPLAIALSAGLWWRRVPSMQLR